MKTKSCTYLAGIGLACLLASMSPARAVAESTDKAPSAPSAAPQATKTVMVKGLLVAKDGQPLPDKKLHAFPVGADGQPIIFLVPDAEGRMNPIGFDATSDQDGRFTLEIYRQYRFNGYSVTCWNLAMLERDWKWLSKDGARVALQITDKVTTLDLGTVRGE